METYPDQLVLGTSRQILSVWAEADAPDVEITYRVDRLILQHADLLTRLHIEDLGRTVAAGGDVLAVGAEANAAYDALVL